MEFDRCAKSQFQSGICEVRRLLRRRFEIARRRERLHACRQASDVVLADGPHTAFGGRRYFFQLPQPRQPFSGLLTADSLNTSFRTVRPRSHECGFEMQLYFPILRRAVSRKSFCRRPQSGAADRPNDWPALNRRRLRGSLRVDQSSEPDMRQSNRPLGGATVRGNLVCGRGCRKSRRLMRR